MFRLKVMMILVNWYVGRNWDVDLARFGRDQHRMDPNTDQADLHLAPKWADPNADQAGPPLASKWVRSQRGQTQIRVWHPIKLDLNADQRIWSAFCSRFICKPILKGLEEELETSNMKVLVTWIIFPARSKLTHFAF